MTLFLAALGASYLVVLLIGVIVGLYLNREMRRVPDHPVLQGFRPTGNANYTVRLRLVEPPPYDQDRETRLGG